MARPKNDRKIRKETQPLLDDNDLYRAIKKHPKVTQYDLTIDEIKAVFRAYADIVYRCLINSIRVNIPHLGEFYRQRMKGFKGGYVKVPVNPFEKGSEMYEQYVEQKPDYYMMQFEFKNYLRDRFKQETEIKDV